MRVEFFVIGRLSSAATSRGERLEDSFNPLTHSQNWDFDRFTLLLAIFGSIGRRSPFRSESSSGVELRGLSAQTSGGMLHSSSIHHYTTLQTLNILQMIAQEEIRAVPRQLARHHDIPPNPLSSLFRLSVCYMQSEAPQVGVGIVNHIAYIYIIGLDT